MSMTHQCIECQEDTYLAQTSNGSLGFSTSQAWGTFECFFRLESKPDYSCVFKSYCTSSWETRFNLEITSTQVAISWYGDDDTADLTNYYSVSIGTGTWYHLVFKYDAGDGEFHCHYGTPGSTYKSGYTTITETTDTGSASGMLALFAASDKQRVGIGARQDGTGVMDARICEYRFWSDERTDAELGPESGGGYNDRMCPESAPTGGLHYWKLNEASGNQTDHWGTVDSIPATDGTNGSFEYDDYPFEAPAEAEGPPTGSLTMMGAGK